MEKSKEVEFVEIKVPVQDVSRDMQCGKNKTLKAYYDSFND